MNKSVAKPCLLHGRTLVMLAAALFRMLPVLAVPAHPGLGTVRQPDGTEVRIQLRGDEWCHWHEDEAGYSVVRESVSGEWVYADVGSDGEFVPTALRVGRDDPSRTLAKGLRSSARQLRASNMRAAMRDQTEKRKTATKGTLRNLVVLVQFPNLKFKYGISDFQRLYNETGYSTSGAHGSVKDYYNEVSYGQLNLESVVAGPVTVSKNYASYGENAIDSEAVKDMVAEALALLDKTGFDFSQCDVDGDGEIDGIDIIHAGYGAEYGGNSQNYIWSHQWQLRTAVYYDGVRIFNYHTEPEIDGWESDPSSNKITPIGVICHETGHFLGLPDLYDTDYSSSGCGSFCLMSGGSWNGDGMRPAHMSAWCKTKLGWVTPTEITETGDYTLPRVEDNRTIYKLHGNFTSEKEYFLVENRQGHGFDADLPGSARGILIWHIDDAKSNNKDENHYWVDLEEASGTQHLQLSKSVDGDDADYWRSTTKSSFSASSTPNTASYTGGALGISLSSISASGASMTFHASTSIGSTIPLGTALDNSSLTFTTGGDAAWFGQSETASDGISAAQSGVIADNKSSWLQTTLTGPGELSFKWKASSEDGCDVLRLVVDGVNVAAISGETGWQTVSTNLAMGSHTVRWSYVKDYSAKEGKDCGWVDRVIWTATAVDDDSARVTVPQGGGTATSSAITLSAVTVYSRRDIPSWIKSVVLNCGTSSMNLGGGNSFGSTTAGMTGTATYTVTADTNTGAERTWTWNIRSQAGDILHTLVVTQPGSDEEEPDEKPDLTVEPADGWPAGLFLSASAESIDECDEFATGESIYLNSCFGNIGAVAASSFAVLHEILDEDDNIVASWRYDHPGGMAAGAQLCWSGATWEALNLLPAGIYILRCTLDPDNAVEEEDETNNLEEYYFEIVGTEIITVSFDGNGGTPSSTSEDYIVGSLYGALPSADWSGHVFAGWYTAPVGGVRVAENSTVAADVDTLYAHWTSRPLADIVVSRLSIPKTTIPYGEDLSVVFSVRNAGSADAQNVSAVLSGIYADSSGTTWSIDIGTLQPGEAREIASISIPVGTFTGSVSFQAHATTDTEESDTGNNVSVPVTVTFLPRESGGAGYGPFGTDDDVVSDAVAPTMLVNAAVTVRGEPAARNDCVAAYRTDTGELCGLGKVLGDDGRMSMVMNINAGVKVHFKIWTSVSGLEQPEILDCDAASDMTMPSPGTFLTGRTLSFASSTQLDVVLQAAKWHQVSFNVLPSDPSPSAVFADVADKIGYVTSGSRYWSPVYGGNLSSIAVGAGYWVQTTEPNVTLSVSGTPDPTVSIALKSGWNLIGYTPVSSAPVAKALASALSSGIIAYVCYGSGIYPGTLTTMYPGNGYWVYAVRAGTISYDPVSYSASTHEWTPERVQPETYGPFGEEGDITGGDAVAPTLIQNAQFVVNGEVAADGDCVAAYRMDDGRLCGLARVSGGDGRFSMVLYLNEGTIVQFKVWQSASGMEAPVILDAADTWVAPAPGGGALTGVALSASAALNVEISLDGEISRSERRVFSSDVLNTRPGNWMFDCAKIPSWIHAIDLYDGNGVQLASLGPGLKQRRVVSVGESLVVAVHVSGDAISDSASEWTWNVTLGESDVVVPVMNLKVVNRLSLVDDSSLIAIAADPWPEGLDGFSMSAARTYDGMIFREGVLVGTIRVKTTQGEKKKGKMTSTVSAVVKTATSTYSYTGATTTTGEMISNWAKKTAKAPALAVTLGCDGMRGVFGGNADVKGARCVAARVTPYIGTWTTTLVDDDGNPGHLNFAVDAKGAIMVSGAYPDGRKAIGTAQLVVGVDAAWIPWVATTPSGGALGFVVRIFGETVVVDEFNELDGSSTEFESNDCIAALESEDGWLVSALWSAKDESRSGYAAVVRAQAPVIEKFDFVEETTNYLGVSYLETVKVNGAGYPVKFSATKLPTGLSINATTGKISGTPVRAGTFVATIKATSVANAKWSDTIQKTFVIEKLPAWAIGTFNGCGMLSDGTTEGEYGDSAIFTLSVTSAGKLSGKVQFKGLTYTLSASSFAEFAVGDYGGRFVAVAKSGKNSYLADIAVAAPLEDGGMPEVGGIIEIGSRIVDFGGYRSLWGTSDGKMFAKKKLNKKKLTLKGADFGLASGEQLTLVFDATGKVKITGKFVTGKKNGKNVTYSASASATICATELYLDEDEEWCFAGDIFVYFPAKSAKKFGGFFRQVTVWSAEGLALQAY